MGLSDSGTHALIRVDPASLGQSSDDDPHGLMWTTQAAAVRAQAVKFVVSGGVEF